MVDIRVGQTAVPNPLKGLDQADAEAALIEADLLFVYAGSQYSTLYAVGEIMDVDVTEGADIDPGSTVTLTVSLGTEGSPGGMLHRHAVRKRKRRRRRKLKRRIRR